MASTGGEASAQQRGPMQRTAVLEDMLRMLPTEVSAQVEEISKEEPAKAPERPVFRRSRTQGMMLPGGSGDLPATSGAPSDISLQRRCASLESQLDKWVGIAQLLASELAYRERRLWDWQMDNTNTKAILQKFKDRLKKTDKPKGGGGAGLRNSLLARSSAAAGTALPSSASGGVEPGTPRQIPTSAAGISMLIVEANDADARALSDSCRAIGYRVATASSGEEALELVTASLKAPGERGTTEGGEVRGRGAARESEGALAAAAAVWEGG